LRHRLPIWNQQIFYEILSHYAESRRWLDLGCGRGVRDPALLPVRARMKERLYVGIDSDLPSLRDCREQHKILANAESLPFPDGAFDLVTSNMVVEHLRQPIRVLQETNRILDDGGILLIHTAAALHYTLLAGRLLSAVLPQGPYARLVSGYTGREVADIFPAFYRANTVRALRDAAAKAGFAAGFVAHLETPVDREFENHFRPFIPIPFKSTLLAVYIKLPIHCD
jgi:ubiquinone/menaquinone biosynthesis C-methylase UbiE